MVITDGSFLKMSFTLKLKGSIFLCQCFNYYCITNYSRTLYLQTMLSLMVSEY